MTVSECCGGTHSATTLFWAAPIAHVDTLDANLRLGFPADARDYGIGAQILVDLGLKRLLLMTNNPAKRDGIDGFGLEITERVPLPIEPNQHNQAYMETKRRRMGHLLFDASSDGDA